MLVPWPRVCILHLNILLFLINNKTVQYGNKWLAASSLWLATSAQCSLPHWSDQLANKSGQLMTIWHTKATWTAVLLMYVVDRSATHSVALTSSRSAVNVRPGAHCSWLQSLQTSFRFQLQRFSVFYSLVSLEISENSFLQWCKCRVSVFYYLLLPCFW